MLGISHCSWRHLHAYWLALRIMSSHCQGLCCTRSIKLAQHFTPISCSILVGTSLFTGSTAVSTDSSNSGVEPGIVTHLSRRTTIQTHTLDAKLQKMRFVTPAHAQGYRCTRLSLSMHVDEISRVENQLLLFLLIVFPLNNDDLAARRSGLLAGADAARHPVPLPCTDRRGMRGEMVEVRNMMVHQSIRKCFGYVVDLTCLCEGRRNRSVLRRCHMFVRIPYVVRMFVKKPGAAQTLGSQGTGLLPRRATCGFCCLVACSARPNCQYSACCIGHPVNKGRNLGFAMNIAVLETRHRFACAHARASRGLGKCQSALIVTLASRSLFSEQ